MSEVLFIDLGSTECGKVEHLPGVQHRFRQRRHLRARQATQNAGHQEGGDLVIRQLVGGISRDDEVNFLARQLLAVALLSDQFDKQHAVILSP
jgi:hypothetical protein